MIRNLLLLGSLMFTAAPAFAEDEPPALALEAAAHAERHYDDAQVELLANLVRFRTVHQDGIANAENPEFRAFAGYLRERATEFGLDFKDLGGILVIGLGDATSRLGIVTHGDVQPADATKWQRSPFELDAESEPGRLIARGAEDDKAPIATALYAMKTIKELGVPLARRIELIVALTEESDWAPFRAALAKYPPPEMNIAIDSQYPVVVAEKGFGALTVNFPAVKSNGAPTVAAYEGGVFISQVPEDASITLHGADDALIARIRERAKDAADGMTYRIEEKDGTLIIRAKGKAAHSSTPENGVNALAHVASLLKGEDLPDSAASRALDFVNALIGTGMYGEQFGDLAYAHPFMGPLTLNLGTVRTTANGVELGISLRSPAGKTTERLDADLRAAIAAWSASSGIAAPGIETDLMEAYLPEQPGQVAPLLSVFEHYTGIDDAKPISIGGGTNARLLPNAVNFGPSMPGAEYTGHSEHEFITREQMTLNLRMYTAMMAWLATDASPSK